MRTMSGRSRLQWCSLRGAMTSLTHGRSANRVGQVSADSAVLGWPDLRPYTSTGKHCAGRWQSGLRDALSRQPGAASNAAGRRLLLNMIASITGRLSGANDHLRLSEDLHLDSLGRVQVQSALEQRVGLELKGRCHCRSGTLGGLRALLGGRGNGPSSQTAECGGSCSGEFRRSVTCVWATGGIHESGI
jgi:long-chain acyl-CoA synthetase